MFIHLQCLAKRSIYSEQEYETRRSKYTAPATSATRKVYDNAIPKLASLRHHGQILLLNFRCHDVSVALMYYSVFVLRTQ